jgi:tRNA pseudouridine55 synthase
VKVVRGIVGVKKVGHAGSLDPFADGVLLLVTGRATKKVTQLMELQKEYVGEIRLGVRTDTDDLTGEITSEQACTGITMDRIEDVCRQFTGEIDQLPPVYSAKKIKGERYYKIARRGGEVERRVNRVHVYSLDILDYTEPMLRIRVKCSKGTYIRALARDIGDALGCGGHLHALTRTRIGDYTIEDSMTIDQFEKELS